MVARTAILLFVLAAALVAVRSATVLESNTVFKDGEFALASSVPDDEDWDSESTSTSSHESTSGGRRHRHQRSTSIKVKHRPPDRLLGTDDNPIGEGGAPAPPPGAGPSALNGAAPAAISDPQLEKVYSKDPSDDDSRDDSSSDDGSDDQSKEEHDGSASGDIGSDMRDGDMNAFLDEHNAARAKQNVPPVVWSSACAEFAQKWVNYLKEKKNCQMQHSPADKQVSADIPLRTFGENLAWFMGTPGTPAKVVKLWMDEEKFYKANGISCMTASGDSTCGHFTQVMWKDTKSIGCAKGSCGQSTVWSCNYDPPGNWVGQQPF